MQKPVLIIRCGELVVDSSTTPKLSHTLSRAGELLDLQPAFSPHVFPAVSLVAEVEHHCGDVVVAASVVGGGDEALANHSRGEG